MFTLIDEQDDFLVVSKDDGVSFHNKEGELGLINHIRQKLNIEVLYSVHRLDKVTSGLILFAKNKKCARRFQELFSSHQIQKKYIAISDQRPKKKQGRVQGDMDRSRRGSWKLLRTKLNPAITDFKSHYLNSSNVRLFVLTPKTGKTHQLRVMMKSLGSPILGDELYGGRKAARCYLHAYSLNFVLDQEFSYTDLPKWEYSIDSKVYLE